MKEKVWGNGDYSERRMKFEGTHLDLGMSGRKVETVF